MDPIKEGKIRQCTDNPLWHELRMLSSGDKVIGRSVVRRNDMIYIQTNFEQVPIYSLKMNGNLMKLLKEHRGVWDGE